MGAVSPRPIMLKATPPTSPRPIASDQSTSFAEAPKLSISRNYVIPPRPKPGRKPSSEVPPSRRKAQNREAQRAFRERKSQAVRMLEAQLAEQARQFEEQQLRMQQQIETLRKEKLTTHQSPSQGNAPRTPQSITAFPHLTTTAPSGPNSPSSPQPGSPSAISPLSSGSTAFLAPSVQQAQSLGSPFGNPQTPADVVGLELLDHVLDQKLPVDRQTLSPSLRRPSRSHSSPESPKSPGVVRVSPPPTSSPLDLVNTSWSQPPVPLRRRQASLETDFTTVFSRRRSSVVRPLALNLPPTPRDRCGFCTDNSMCICAASAAREEAGVAMDTVTLGSPLSAFSSVAPSLSPQSPASPSSTTAVPPVVQPLSSPKQSSPEAKNGECTGNPQTCSQCRFDPMLTLFCSAISSKRSALTTQGTYIPAQAAYKTLSRHPRFGDADLGEIVDALNARGSQVEVNSIAKVLRILDTK